MEELNGFQCFLVVKAKMLRQNNQTSSVEISTSLQTDETTSIAGKMLGDGKSEIYIQFKCSVMEPGLVAFAELQTCEEYDDDEVEIFDDFTASMTYNLSKNDQRCTSCNVHVGVYSLTRKFVEFQKFDINRCCPGH